jgi:hypothetical protein
MNKIYPKVVIFFITLSVIVGGTIILLSQPSLFNAFKGLANMLSNELRYVGETLGKTFSSS